MPNYKIKKCKFKKKTIKNLMSMDDIKIFVKKW